jgi:anti-sigma regulatory factor (Ser/Thr protein kinase)/ActR/RegA family two-component response regulator
MDPQASVLLIGVGPALRRLFEPAVESGDLALVEMAEGDASEARLRAASFALVLLESQSAERAAERLKALRAARDDAKVIVVSHDSGAEGVLAAIREHAFAYFPSPVDPGELARAIGRALGLADWQDGIEVVSARPDWITLRLRCRRSTADRLMGFLARVPVALSTEDRENLATAVREILLNAIEYGGELDPRKRVEVSRIQAPQLILYHVVDPGRGFSLEELPHAAVSNPPTDPAAHVRHREEKGMRPGGFGILVARNLVDDLIYNERGNEVLLLKRVPSAAPDAPPPDAEGKGSPA